MIGSVAPERLGAWEPAVRSEERQIGTRAVIMCRPWRAGLGSDVLAALERAYGRLQDGSQLHGYLRAGITAEPIELQRVAYSRGGGSLWGQWLGLWHCLHKFPP